MSTTNADSHAHDLARQRQKLERLGHAQRNVNPQAMIDSMINQFANTNMNKKHQGRLFIQHKQAFPCEDNHHTHSNGASPQHTQSTSGQNGHVSSPVVATWLPSHYHD